MNGFVVYVGGILVYTWSWQFCHMCQKGMHVTTSKLVHHTGRIAFFLEKGCMH